MGAMLVLLTMLACGEAELPSPPEDGPSALDAAEAVRVEVHAAHQAWSEGRHPEASARVRGAYSRYFEPLEPALRARDPQRTLALEYEFGVLGARLQGKADAQVVAQQVQQLTRDMDSLVSLLPMTPTTSVPVDGAPKGEEVALPSHLVGEQ